MYMYVYSYILVYAMLDYVHIQMYWVVISFWPGDASNRSSTVLPIVFACLINVIHVMNKSLFRRLLTCGIVAVTAVVWPAIHWNRRASLKLTEPVHWLGKEKRSPSTGMTILESTSDFVHSIPKSPLPALMYLMRIAIDSWIVLCTWSMRVTDLPKCQQLQEDAKQLKLRCGEAGPTVNSRNAWIDHKIINSDTDHFANGNPSKCYEQTTNSGEEVSHIDQIRSLIAENADLYGKRGGPISKRLESIRHVQKHVKWGPPLKQVPVSYDDWQRHFWERGGSIPLSPETPQNEMVPRTRSKTGSPIAACKQ